MDQLYSQPYGELPFTYPPVAALFFIPFSLLPAPAFVALLTAASLHGLWWVISSVLHVTVGQRLAIACAAPMLWISLTFEPVTETLSFGQVNLLLLLIIAVDLFRGGGRWRGISLGLAMSIKLTPLIFLIYLLLAGEWRVMARAGATFLLAMVIPFVLFPRSSLEFWTHAISDPTRIGGVAYAGNQSMNGALWRLTQEGGLPLLHILLSVMVLAYAIVIQVWSEGDHRVMVCLSWALVGLLISPISWSHHWVWTLPGPFPCALGWLRRRGIEPANLPCPGSDLLLSRWVARGPSPA